MDPLVVGPGPGPGQGSRRRSLGGGAPLGGSKTALDLGVKGGVVLG